MGTKIGLSAIVNTRARMKVGIKSSEILIEDRLKNDKNRGVSSVTVLLLLSPAIEFVRFNRAESQLEDSISKCALRVIVCNSIYL